MKKLLLFWLLFIFSIGAHVSADNNTITPDPAVRKGVLANGLTYYIRHFENPKERADFYIVHNVGALQEDDNQDGLAHFLEHMAFNGTKHYPKKSMLEFLAANGVAFGANINAYTNRTETVYNLSNIPLMRDSFVDSVLLVLHDWSSYIACEPEEIEAERGVVREEWRRSDEPRSRTARANAKYEYMDSKYAKRTVLGNWDVVNNFSRHELLDFYHKWYRPDLQAIVIVGDIDVDDMEARVTNIFSTLPAAQNPAPKEIYDIPYTWEPVIATVTDPDIQYITAKINLKQPYPAWEERQLKSTAKKSLERGLFTTLVYDRFDRAGKENKMYRRAVAVNTQLSTCRYMTMITVTPNGNDLESGLESVFTELHRIEQNGFLPDEFERAKAQYAKSRSIYSEKTVADRNSDYVKMYVENFLRNEPYMELEAQREMTRELFASITLEELNALIPEFLTDSEKLIIYTANEDNTATIPSVEWTLEKIEEIADMNLPQISDFRESVDLTLSPVAGSIKKDKETGYLDAREWTLSNGAKVVWMQREGLSGVAQMSIQAYCPVSYAKHDDVTGIKLINTYLSSMGIRNADKNGVNAALIENNINTSIRLMRESTTFRGSSPVKDFEITLRLMHLYMTEPNFAEEEWGEFISRTKESLSRPESSRALFTQERAEVMYGGHRWNDIVTPGTCDRVDAATARDIYMRQFGNAADFTFFIVGSMPVEEVIPLVEKYIASLPSAGKAGKYREDTFKRIKGNHELLRDYDEEKVTVPKAAIERFYYGPMKYTAANNMALLYLRNILSERYMTSIREERGGTYYVGVKTELEPRPEGDYLVVIDFETDPELSEILLYEVGRAINDLAAAGPTEREMDETKRYMLKRNSERVPVLESNLSHWSNLLINRYTTGTDLHTEDDQTISSVTARQVQEAARLITNGDSFTSVMIRR